MSRGNVFKVSGSMALGGADYGHSDMDDIKNSLKLLKAKKNQRQSGEESYGYGDSSNAPRSYYKIIQIILVLGNSIIIKH